MSNQYPGVSSPDDPAYWSALHRELYGEMRDAKVVPDPLNSNDSVRRALASEDEITLMMLDPDNSTTYIVRRPDGTVEEVEGDKL